MSPEQEPLVKVSFEGLAEWFIAVGAFIYTTGFLVAVIFTGYLGAREATIELFRAKYVLMGILCLAFPVTVIGFAYATFSLVAHPEKKPKEGSTEPEKLHPTVIVLLFNMLLTLYFFIMFAPQGYIKNHPYLVGLIFVVTIVGYRSIEMSENLIKGEFLKKYKSITRVIFCILVVLGLDVFCFYGMKLQLLELVRLSGHIWPRSANFFLFVGLISYLLSRIKPRSEVFLHKSARKAISIIVMCIVVLLYILMVYTFSYHIYPLIPANRGGGDFTDTPLIVLHYSDIQTNPPPVEICKGSMSQELVLIDKTGEAILVADPNDAGGPSEWKKGNAKPHIYEVSQSSVSFITYLSRRNPDPNDANGPSEWKKGNAKP